MLPLVLAAWLVLRLRSAVLRLGGTADVGDAVHELGFEEHVGVGKHAVLQRDHHKLRERRGLHLLTLVLFYNFEYFYCSVGLHLNSGVNWIMNILIA